METQAPGHRPAVGIALTLDAEGRWRPGRAYHYLDAAYAEAVAEAGGAPVYLPCAGDAADLVARNLVARVDALVLPGGDDFLPEAPYPPEVRFAAAPPAQVAFDRALLAAALTRGIPVLGICYGLQLLVLHHGGCLHHHLPLDVPGVAEHQLADPAARHGLRIEPGSRLAAILDGLPPAVNSRHHQAVAEPGRGLRVCARAEDGVVEAAEAKAADGPFVLGVQWHPESMDAAHRRRLFGALVGAVQQMPEPPASSGYTTAPRPRRPPARRLLPPHR